jgi:membrane protease YdiL (CAAX protease family)
MDETRRRRPAFGRRTAPEGSAASRPAEQRWGLGDAAAGFVAAQVLSLLVGAAVVGLLVVRGMPMGAGVAAALDGHGRNLSATLTVAGLALLQVPLWATEVGTVWWAGQVRGTGVRKDFGFVVRPLDVVVGLVAGAATQLVVTVGYGIVKQLTGWSASDQTARQIAAKGGGWVGVTALLVLFAGVAPLVEELFYRGLVQRSLERRFAPGWALLIAAFVFAAIHLEPVLLPGLFVAGLVFGAFAQRTGRLGPAIFAHVGFNASTILVMALTR